MSRTELMSIQPNTLEQIDEAFRQAFRAELPERVQALEEHILAIERGDLADDRFNAFYRGVHNIKGNAATFGLYALVSICHRLEDILRAAPFDQLRGDPAFPRVCLTLVDLMVEGAEDGEDVLDQIETRLQKLTFGQQVRQRRRALLVGDSRATLSLCREVLSQNEVDAVDARDGYIALHRVLTEPFCMVITTSELKLVRGESLVSALRTSVSRNRRIPTILLTSGQRPDARYRRDTDPDYIVPRGPLLAKQLMAVVHKICASTHE